MPPSVVVFIVGFLLAFLVLAFAAVSDHRGHQRQVRTLRRLFLGVLAVTGVAVMAVAWVD
jgi:threonine/homoserine/homoserine lactone efflux protein